MTVTEKYLSGPQERAAAAARASLLEMGATLTTVDVDGYGDRWWRPRPYGPDRFTWGRVEAVHQINGYVIIEYTPNVPGSYNAFELKEREMEEGRRSFHPWVDGKDTGHSFSSLDRALLGCVAWRADVRHGGYNRAANSRAVTYMARLIELEDA